nr:hypothetical protein [Priestia megaterium]
MTATYTGSRGWLPRVIIALAATRSAQQWRICFSTCSFTITMTAFYGLGSVVVINLPWVRNGYGIVWLFLSV